MRKILLISLIPVLVLLALGALSGYAIHREVNHKDCGFTQVQAQERVIEDLTRRGLNPQLLDLKSSHGTCSYFFAYRDSNSHLSYSVQSTWLHGVKLSRYDYARDNQD